MSRPAKSSELPKLSFDQIIEKIYNSFRDEEVSKKITEDFSTTIGDLVAANKELSLEELQKIMTVLTKNHEVNPGRNASVLMIGALI